LRICLVTYEFPPKIFGGAGTYAGLLYKGLRKSGVEVTVISHGEPDESEEVIKLKTPGIRYWRRPFFTYHAGRYLKKYLQEENFDLLHYNEPHIILSKPRIPTISTLHSTGINELATKIKLSRLMTPMALIETLVKTPVMSLGDINSCRNSDLVITPNTHLKHMIEKYCFYDGDQVHIVHNGIQLDSGDRDLDTHNISKFGLEKKKYIFFAGRLDPIKGLEYLIKAFKEAKLGDVKLAIAGAGYLEKSLKELSNSKKIVFLGYISDSNTLSSLYRNSLLFVLPSLYEAMPMVLLEAMSHGVPVVASRVGGIPEFIHDDINGYLVEPKDYHELGNKIRLLVENEFLREKIGAVNMDYVKENYSLEKMTQKTIQVYKCLLSEKEEVI
jgi:glycosyltransferase involved in cell wall biosynthesis